MRKAVVSAVVVALAMGMATQAETLRIEGSTTVGPVADAFAEYFKGVYPNLEITVNKSGSGNGATALIEGRCDIATMSRFMSPDGSQGGANKVYRWPGPFRWMACAWCSPSSGQSPDHTQVRDIS
jgi:ABC-type phosphate transport system substrate-binding protein